MSTQRVLATVSIILGCLFGFFALWKWALFGLDADIGFACGLTSFVLVGAGTFGLIE